MTDVTQCTIVPCGKNAAIFDETHHKALASENANFANEDKTNSTAADLIGSPSGGLSTSLARPSKCDDMGLAGSLKPYTGNGKVRTLDIDAVDDYRKAPHHIIENALDKFQSVDRASENKMSNVKHIQLRIKKSPPLMGDVSISGAKNAALPIMAATLLSGEAIQLKQLPSLSDVDTMFSLLETMGVAISRSTGVKNDSNFTFDSSSISTFVAPDDFAKKMRASILVLGPLLARFGSAVVSLPGGCAIGERSVQLHLDGLRAMGASIKVEDGCIKGHMNGRLQGAHIVFNTVTVTGTENILMAACLAEGETVLDNCAREPEVVDLANFLVSLGATIEGIGTSSMCIQGCDKLRGGVYSIIPDRIEAGTYLVAAAATGGCITVSPIASSHLEATIQKLREAGAQVDIEGDVARLDMRGRRPKAVSITTQPFPGFPTDMQAQFMALNTIAKGDSVIDENIFENRFMHAEELKKMGATIRLNSKSAEMTGIECLQGMKVKATDLRATAALVIAGLVAEGETWVDRVDYLDRGYNEFDQILQRLGAIIERVKG